VTTRVLDRPNRYAATCVHCRGRVEAGAGRLASTDNGWAAAHLDGECAEPQAAKPTTRVTEDGVYQRTRDQAIFKVKVAVHGSGQLYASRLILTDCPEPATCKRGHDDGRQHRHGRFEYEAGAIHTLQAVERLTEHDARVYGRLYGVCVFCGTTLTDERSIALGMGPWCRAKYFADDEPEALILEP
jgi:hypothetical protein